MQLAMTYWPCSNAMQERGERALRVKQNTERHRWFANAELMIHARNFIHRTRNIPCYVQMDIVEDSGRR